MEDDSGAVQLISSKYGKFPPISVGTYITATGAVERIYIGHGIARCDGLIIHGKRSPSPPIPLNSAEVGIPRTNNRIVRLRGIVREVFRDEIDPPVVFLTLCSGKDTTYVAFTDATTDISAYKRLTDADITVTGLCSAGNVGTRWQIGHILECTGPESFEAHQLPPSDPFAVPILQPIRRTNPSVVMTMTRRRVVGNVIAIWQGNRMLVRDDMDLLHNVELAGSKVPTVGERVEVVGLPETDLYRINLSSAIWRPHAGSPIPPAPAKPTETKSLLSDRQGNPKILSVAHGKAIALQGSVIDRAGAGSLTLKSGNFAVPVDASACPSALDGIAVGCEVRIAGTCIVETENWRPYSDFPHSKGILLAMRGPDDAVILARPPWWTPGRLMVIIGSLLAALLGILVWNRILNRLVERRSRELLREQAWRVGDKLKVGERTRLAVELHDSLSQTLTGVSFQIDAAEQARQKDPSQIKKYLDIARQTLQSCREELRNCLWDLRNNALEEDDAEVAIRRTVEPQIGDAELTVDFKVPRRTLTDNTFHAILCIVRELAVNAARHGNAKHITVRGGTADGRLAFSVTDDGCGFDPDHRPGVDEGHFGLLGVSERIENLGGTLDVASSPGNGSAVNATISL